MQIYQDIDVAKKRAKIKANQENAARPMKNKSSYEIIKENFKEIRATSRRVSTEVILIESKVDKGLEQQFVVNEHYTKKFGVALNNIKKEQGI